MTEIFRVGGSDLRDELLTAVKNDQPFTSQAIGGKEIEVFNDDLGFVLLQKNRVYMPDNNTIQRIRAVIEVYKLLGRSSLRTGYYTCRQKPEYAQYFKGAGKFSDKWLDAVSKAFEIICDIDREVITFGTPDGVIFYPYSRRYGAKETMISLSEDIAKIHLKYNEVEHCMNILVNEKMANALELINDQTGFLQMLNMMCVTRGGRYNRAILKLVSRFDNLKNVLLWTDADVFGVDIREVVFRGSKNLRHQTPTQTSRSAYNVGLFPSVAAELEVPVDIDEKKPMSGDEKTGARKMVEHLRRAGLHTADLQTFYDDKTFEIEGLHAKFTNRDGKPIGTQIYIVEYLRAMGLECKPQPPEDDIQLQNELCDALYTAMRDRIYDTLEAKLDFDIDTNVINDAIVNFIGGQTDAIAVDKGDEIRNLVYSISVDEIREKIRDWYVNHPKTEIYNIADIAEEMISSVHLNIDIDTSNLQAFIEDKLSEVVDEIDDHLSIVNVDSDIVVQEFEKVEVVKDYYDMVLRRLGASKDDILKIREALQHRLES